MGPQSNEEYALYCNGQQFNGIQGFGFEPQNEPYPLDSFLHMKPLDLAYTIAYDYIQDDFLYAVLPAWCDIPQNQEIPGQEEVHQQVRQDFQREGVVAMKKIPTLFERVYENHKIVGVTEKVTPGMEWVLDGEGIATEKIDGSCTAIINGVFYKRYDAKKGKKPPEGAIPCCEPDPITGHWPHWVKVDCKNPADKWFEEAYRTTSLWEYQGLSIPDGTYEAIGKHFQGDPYNLSSVPGQEDVLVRHGEKVLEVTRTFDGIRDYLATHEIEGIVFWKDGEPKCKIKRSDFGFEWPVKGK